MAIFAPVSIPESVLAWYAVQWRILVRRLRYRGSAKARKARAKILLHWGPRKLPLAYAQALDGCPTCCDASAVMCEWPMYGHPTCYRRMCQRHRRIMQVSETEDAVLCLEHAERFERLEMYDHE